MAKPKKTEGEKKSPKSKITPAVAEGFLSLGAVVLGAWAGAAIGKPSLAAGVILAGGGLTLKTAKPDMEKIGHYSMLFGLGMTVGHTDLAVAETPSTVEGLSGMDGWLADATARAKTYGKGLLKKTYLNKIEAVAKATGTEEGIGNPSYYGPDGTQLSMSQADALIKQLQQASVAKPSLSGLGKSMLEDLKGLAGTQPSLVSLFS